MPPRPSTVERAPTLLRLHAQRLRLPLAAPLQTGAGRFEQRATLLLRAEVDVDGRREIGWGEAAPLAGWTEESIAELESTLKKIALPYEIIGFLQDERALDRLDPALTRQPTLKAGIELALLDALGRAEGRSIAALLAGRRGVEPLAEIPVQRTLGSLPLKACRTALLHAWEHGYRAAKLKVGAQPPEDDRLRIEALAEAVPDLILRLDANGAWTPEVALDMLVGLPVALIEQPVAPAQFDALLARRRPGSVPIAADESCSSPHAASALIEDGRVDALVIKPSTLGGLLPSLGVIEAARTRGIEVILSNLMESAVGRRAAMQLAAAFPELPGPHGLATGQWFAADLCPTPDRIEHGALQVSTEPGLGFVPSVPPR